MVLLATGTHTHFSWTLVTISETHIILNWNKGIFEKEIKLTDANGQVGFLRSNPWSTSATGDLNGKKYSFKAKGVFRKVVLIT